jgi:hypothetical protein
MVALRWSVLCVGCILLVADILQGSHPLSNQCFHSRLISDSAQIRPIMGGNWFLSSVSESCQGKGVHFIPSPHDNKAGCCSQSILGEFARNSKRLLPK